MYKKTKVILIIIAILIAIIISNKTEHFTNTPKSVQIIILCKKANQQLYNAYMSRFPNQNIIFISDEIPVIKKDNVFHYKDNPEFYGMHSRIKHTSWDKAFQHLSENNNHDYYWFIEDDVFISDKNVNKKIDQKYNDDFLIFAWHNFDRYTKSPINKFWFNSHIDKTLKNVKYFPDKFMSGSLNVFTRLSKKHVQHILNFQKKHKRLIFHEMLIPSIARENDLKIKIMPKKKIKSILSPRPIYVKHNNIEAKLKAFNEDKVILAHPAKNWYKIKQNL